MNTQQIAAWLIALALVALLVRVVEESSARAAWGLVVILVLSVLMFLPGALQNLVTLLSAAGVK